MNEWAAAEGISRYPVSVLLATTGRPDMARACVESIRATAQVEIVAAVDACEDTSKALAGLVDVLDYSHAYRGCSKAWNDALRRASGHAYVLAADDLHFREGWLDAALSAMQTLPDGWGLVGLNDGHWGEELSTHYLVSRRMVVEVLGGVIAWEHYHHSFNDVEINERAKRAGRYLWCAGARVDHVHWLFGDRPQDGTDTRQLALHEQSQLTYVRRAAAGFPNDYDPVIGGESA